MIVSGKELLSPVTTEEYRVSINWEGAEGSLHITNISDHPICLQKIPVLEMGLPFGPDTPVFGEGYNMLCQYGGTVKELKMTGSHGDFNHYHLSAPTDLKQVYHMIRFTEQNGKSLLIGFSSCFRFSGEFWFSEKKLLAVLNLEGIPFAPGQMITLESVFLGEGWKSEVEQCFAEAIQKNHPRLQTQEIPTGWCSWPVYGPQVTEENIYDNLESIRQREMGLKYIQLDDGYQPYMGDWLKTTDYFPGGMEKLCRTIRKQGFMPAVWVAPFIAEEQSELFQKHPDWFVKDYNGQPLPSDQVSFGGWRHGPWYMLDGTHPEARTYLTSLFQTMREEWQVTYFKLDANMWGALPFGMRFDKNRTSVEAYRMGMQAILEGAGRDSFLVGCNAPMWPSLGLVHGMRVTNDVARNFESFSNIAKQCFRRNWQNNRLWINDPDTVLFRNRDKTIPGPDGKPVYINSGISRGKFLYNATYVLASGGMVLSGDDITEFTHQNVVDLNRLLPPSGVAAVFDNDDCRVGRIPLGKEEILCIFNEDDESRNYQICLENTVGVRDFWTGEELGVWKRGVKWLSMEGCSAAAYVIRNDKEEV